MKNPPLTVLLLGIGLETLIPEQHINKNQKSISLPKAEILEVHQSKSLRVIIPEHLEEDVGNEKSDEPANDNESHEFFHLFSPKEDYRRTGEDKEASFWSINSRS